MLLDAADTAKAEGFIKDYPEEKIRPGIRDTCCKGNHRIEDFNIKPLCCALITIIENPPGLRTFKFEEQSIRSIRMGWTAGFSQPISFQGLEAQGLSLREKSLFY